MARNDPCRNRLPRLEQRGSMALIPLLPRTNGRAHAAVEEAALLRVIAFANQKGGVAKTTTTLNLGVALMERGFRVLLVDLAPQGNLTVRPGVNPGAPGGPL